MTATPTTSPLTTTAPIAPCEVRYIKLGPGGAWADRCFADGELHFSDTNVPRELADSGDFEGIRKHFIASGRTPSKASDLTREIQSFFTLGADCLWITLARGKLWWAFAEPAIHWLGGDGMLHGRRMRRTIGSWRSTDLEGRELLIVDLSSRLTKVEGYRQTICRITKDEPYLLNKINASRESLAARGFEARDSMIAVANEAIVRLHPTDFEVMTDLIFARAGWRRISILGRLQADVDLILEEPITGIRAFVQVKSKASQRVLDDCISSFEDSANDRMFFVCHSPDGALSTGSRDRVGLWVGDALAAQALDAGLFQWLLGKVT